MSLAYKVIELGTEEDRERMHKAEQVYGKFELDFWTGKPTREWEIRQLHDLSINLWSYYIPDFFHRSVQVNRKAQATLAAIYAEIRSVFSPDEQKAYHLDQFVRCYCFGHGSPSLFWWGAAWELSPKTKGDALDWAAEIFVKNGWKRTSAKVFEHW